jgi:hypothetical protein
LFVHNEQRKLCTRTKKLRMPKADSEGCQVWSPNVRAGFHADSLASSTAWDASVACGAGGGRRPSCRRAAWPPSASGQCQRCEESQAPGPWAYNRRRLRPPGAGDPRAGDSKVAKQARPSPSPQGQAGPGHRDIRPASTQAPAIQVPPAQGSTPQIGAIIGPRCEVADQVHQSPIPGPRRDVSTPLALESE